MLDFGLGASDSKFYVKAWGSTNSTGRKPLFPQSIIYKKRTNRRCHPERSEGSELKKSNCSLLKINTFQELADSQIKQIILKPPSN
jgi:hypothetical protein